MSLMSSDIKLGQDVDPTVRRFQAAITRDLEQLYLLMSQGEGGFSNTSPGSVSQDPTTDGLGIEGNQGDYRFSPAVSRAEFQSGGIDARVFLQKSNNLGDVFNRITSALNLGVFKFGGYALTASYASGSGTHAFTAGKQLFIAILQGGGGGNSSVNGTQGSGTGAFGSMGGGGGGAAIIMGRISLSTCSYVVGAGGTVGASPTDGGSTTLTLNSVTVTAGGGAGAGSNGSAYSPGIGGAVSQTDPSSPDMFWIPLPGQAGLPASVVDIRTVGTSPVNSVFYFWSTGEPGKAPSQLINGGTGIYAGTGNGQPGAIEIYEL